MAPAAAFQIFAVVVLGPRLPTDITGAGYQSLPPTWAPKDPGAHELSKAETALGLIYFICNLG